MVKPGADFRLLTAFAAICRAVRCARGSACFAGCPGCFAAPLAGEPWLAPWLAQPAADRPTAAATAAPTTALVVNDIGERPVLVGVIVQT